MQPDFSILVDRIRIKYPLVGYYDAPKADLFSPIITPESGNWKCTFDFFNDWVEGKTVQLTPDNFGCGGCGRALFGIESRSREDFLEFLVGKEGLKDSKELMNEWIESSMPPKSDHNNVFIGPLKTDAYEFLKTVTFFINPDQLSMFVYGANYHAKPNDPIPVFAPFGSGCSMLLSPFKDLSMPQAIIGATDVAMRDRVPADVLAFTVTKPMFERLCTLDERSFLFKPFWKNVLDKREKQG